MKRPRPTSSRTRINAPAPNATQRSTTHAINQNPLHRPARNIQSRRSTLASDDQDQQQHAIIEAEEEDDELSDNSQHRNSHAALEEEDEDEITLSESQDESRIKLARKYLDRIRVNAGLSAVESHPSRDSSAVADEQEEEEQDDGEQEDELEQDLFVRDQLTQDANVTQQKRALTRLVSVYQQSRLWPTAQRCYRLHRLSATSLALRQDDSSCFSGSKDGTIVECDVETGRKLCTWASRISQSIESPPHAASRVAVAPLMGHHRGVSALACSHDQRYLASGGVDGVLKVFDVRIHAGTRASVIHETVAHKGVISGLCFRQDISTLFSCSHDRTVKVWDVQQPQHMYIETLFGHMNHVNAIDVRSKLTCVTASSDKTARLWRVEQESQLLFRAEAFTTSLDAISMITDNTFLTAGQDGSVHHWVHTKKKPSDILASAHGSNWITSLTCLPDTDIAFSGSCDGNISVYEISVHHKLRLLHRIPIVGFVNAMTCARSGRFLLAATGQEHKEGRWLSSIKAAKNGVHVLMLPSNSSAEVDIAVAQTK